MRILLFNHMAILSPGFRRLPFPPSIPLPFSGWSFLHTGGDSWLPWQLPAAEGSFPGLLAPLLCKLDLSPNNRRPQLINQASQAEVCPLARTDATSGGRGGGCYIRSRYFSCSTEILFDCISFCYFSNFPGPKNPFIKLCCQKVLSFRPGSDILAHPMHGP